MASAERIKRINELIKRQLGRIILEEMEFPRGIVATLSEVKTSSDLSECKVFISAFPAGETGNILKILKANVYFLQQLLNKCLRVRVIPRIRFVPQKEDNSLQRVEAILEKIKIKEGE